MKTILIMALIVSCSSTVVKKIGKPSKYAPANYRETGVVKYLNQGADWIIEQRRESAFKEMHDSCNGAYEIVREGNQTQFQASQTMFDSGYWMIEFKCISKTATN